MNTGIKRIADHYGLENQILKMIEEANELAVALCKSLAERTGREIQEKTLPVDVLFEMADVEILLEQLKYLSRTDSTINNIKSIKVERQLQRMKEERQ